MWQVHILFVLVRYRLKKIRALNYSLMVRALACRVRSMSSSLIYSVILFDAVITYRIPVIWRFGARLF